MENKYLVTHDFIKNRWKDAVRENKEGEYALPNPFVPPCVDGLFKCMFYWDTFYTNKGMLLDNKIDYARWNVENLIYMLNKYGCVPNSNSYPGVKHNSQPPYLHFMVEDIYNATKDKKWLEMAFFALKKEYEFWMSKRITPIGLNRYYHHEKTEQEYIDFYDYVATRLDIPKDAPKDIKIKQGSGFNACCEGGLDFSPRYNLEGDDICPIDLNCLLYAMEGNLAKWADMFEKDKKQYYLNQQNKRKDLINKYLYNEKDGLYYDYNFVKGKLETTDFNFTGQFFPYIVGISNNEEKCRYLLSKVEFEFGIASTSPYKSHIEYQAAYPFSWPYDNGITFWALTNMNMKDDALRMGKKYLDLCSNSYLKAGHLWETYNAVVDEIANKKEYPNKDMYDLGNGYYRFVYELANRTWKKNGNPTVINFIEVHKSWSDCSALINAGVVPLSNIFKGGTDYSLVVGNNNVFVETDTINLDVKFDSPAESSKISFRLDQDDNNYIFNYDLTPSLKTGDQAGVTVTDLGNGITRYSFKLSDLTHTKTGNPTVINKVRIRGSWSTGFGYYSVSVEKENNWQELKKGDFVDTPEIFEGDEMSGKAISFNFKLEGSEALTHSDYVNLALANDDGGKWLNVSGEIDLFGDFTTNKGGTVTSLGDGWYKLVIDSAKFNGDGEVTSYVNKILINNIVGKITRVIIDWDSFDFIDFTRDFTQTGTMMRSFEPIDDWKTSDAILEFEYSEIAGSYGGHRNIICVVDKDGHYVGAFAFRDNTHAVNHWNGSSEGSALENSSVTKKEGTDDVYVVRVALKDLNVLSTYTGEESITKIDFASYFSSFRVYSMSIVR